MGPAISFSLRRERWTALRSSAWALKIINTGLQTLIHCHPSTFLRHYKLARSWRGSSHPFLLSRRATHVLGSDLLSRGAPLYWDWTLWCGCTTARLWWTCQCQEKYAVSVVLFFAQHRPASCRGLTRMAIWLPLPNSPHFVQGEGSLPHSDLDSSALASNVLADRDISAPVQPAVATLAMLG